MDNYDDLEVTVAEDAAERVKSVSDDTFVELVGGDMDVCATPITLTLSAVLYAPDRWGHPDDFRLAHVYVPNISRLYEGVKVLRVVVDTLMVNAACHTPNVIHLCHHLLLIPQAVSEADDGTDE